MKPIWKTVISIIIDILGTIIGKKKEEKDKE